MSASSWAAALPAATPVKWSALEVAAFAPYPVVQEQLDPAGKYGRVRWSGTTRRRLAFASPLMILIALLFFAPIIGFAILMGDRYGLTRPDPARTIPAAGIIFSISLLSLLISFGLWLKAGRPDDEFRRYQAGIACVFGAFSALLVVGRGSAASVASWQLWIIPVLAVSVVGAVLSVLLWIALQHARAQSPSLKKSRSGAAAATAATARLERVAAQIDRLSDEQRASVRADLTVAIHDLANRGLISPADADWARGAKLGKLGLRMSQSRKGA